MFKERFSQILQIKQIKPYHIAKATGISPGLMSEYTNGIKTPTTDNLIKISDYLECSVDYLLGRTDDPAIDNHINYRNISNSNNIQGNDNNVINIGSQTDDLTMQFLEMFKNLSIEDKIDVMNFTKSIKKTE